MKHHGVLISFEGGEGAGKSTQMRRLVQWLKKRRIPTVLTLQPGGTQIGEKIREILLDPKNKSLCPLAELFLYEADRAQHIQEVILPALSKNKVIVSDRYSDSSSVYQGICRKLGLKKVEELNRMATGGISPDLTFVLDISEKDGRKRVQRRLSQDVDLSGVRRRVKIDRLEREKLDFHRQVRQGFLKIAKRNPRQYKILDALQSEAALEQQIQKMVQAKLERKGIWKSK